MDRRIALYSFRLGAITAQNVLDGLGWAYDASSFAATCKDPAMLDEVSRYTRAGFESDEAYKGFRHRMGFEI